MKNLIMYLILFVSNLFKLNGLRACRFYPSCSAYSIEAFQKFNFIKAFFLMAKRLLRCHPFSLGGYDPIPPVCNDPPKADQRLMAPKRWWGDPIVPIRKV